jgi:transmembrane sensor
VADEIGPPDSLTLARYLSGELGVAEAAQVERWIEADPANRALVGALREVWTRGHPPDFDPDDALWNRIAARLERPLPKPALVRGFGRWPAQPARRFVPAAAAAAAAAVILAVGATLVVQLRQAEEPVPMREVATARRQRATLDLPDGSRVVLAPESRLRFAADLGAGRAGRARDLLLEGDAYFEVRHDSTRPFRVHAANAVVEDLGTEFVVGVRPEKGGLEVVVVTGAVALREDSAVRPLVTLGRGDRARLDSVGTAVLTRDVNLAPYVAWTQGRLVFDATPLNEAVPALSRWYDLDIRLADPGLAGRRLSATFGTEPVAQVLELIARSLDARVARDGRTVVFSEGRKR